MPNAFGLGLPDVVKAQLQPALNPPRQVQLLPYKYDDLSFDLLKGDTP